MLMCIKGKAKIDPPSLSPGMKKILPSRFSRKGKGINFVHCYNFFYSSLVIHSSKLRRLFCFVVCFADEKCFVKTSLNATEARREPFSDQIPSRDWQNSNWPWKHAILIAWKSGYIPGEYRKGWRNLILFKYVLTNLTVQ